jgi:rhamnogalacturonan endolyase
MKLVTLVSCSFLLAATVGNALGDTLTLNPNADTYTRFGYNHNGITPSTDPVLNIYGQGGNDFMAYIRFDLSSLPAGATIDSATFTVYYEPASRTDTITTGRFANFGLLDVSGNTPQNWDPASLTDSATPGVGQEYGAGNYAALTSAVSSGWLYNLDADNGANVSETIGGSTAGSAESLSGPGLAAFLNGQVADGGLVTIISAINGGTSTSQRGYGYASVNNADSALWPTLNITYTVVPEPSTMAFIGLGLLGLVARLRGKV